MLFEGHVACSVEECVNEVLFVFLNEDLNDERQVSLDVVGNPAEVGHAEHALHIDSLSGIRANVDTGCGQERVDACFWFQAAQQHLAFTNGDDDIVVEVMIDDPSPCFFRKR